MIFAFLAIGILTGSILGVSAVLAGASVIDAFIAYTLCGSLGTVAAAIFAVRRGADDTTEISTEKKCMTFTITHEHAEGPTMSRMNAIMPRRVQLRDPVDRTEYRTSRAIARKSRRNLFSEMF